VLVGRRRAGRTGEGVHHVQCWFCVVVPNKAKCDPGCSSDENCGPSEHCVRCGDDALGSCRACTETKDAVCKAQQPAPKQPQSTEACERDTFFDKDCDAAHPKGHVCPSNKEPEGKGACKQHALPDTWCCEKG
jgi:hypothetical protein